MSCCWPLWLPCPPAFGGEPPGNGETWRWQHAAQAQQQRAITHEHRGLLKVPHHHKLACVNAAAAAAVQADLGPLPDNSPASFFMAQGLKSLAGGNVHAALHRLSRCRDSLLRSEESTTVPDGGSISVAQEAVSTVKGTAGVSAHAQMPGEVSQQQTEHVQQPQHRPAQPPAAAACQLSACCGCLADCYMRLGDPHQAEQLYQEAISSVEVLSESDAEAAHTMSVSLNKLGDLKYMLQQLHEAKTLYRRGLELRQLCCGPLSGGQAGPAEQLELATSLIKVADACKVCSA